MPSSDNGQVSNTLVKSPDGLLHVNANADQSRVVVQNHTADQAFVSTTNDNHEHVTFTTDAVQAITSTNDQHENVVIIDRTGDHPIVTHTSTLFDPPI